MSGHTNPTTLWTISSYALAVIHEVIVFAAVRKGYRCLHAPTSRVDQTGPGRTANQTITESQSAQRSQSRTSDYTTMKQGKRNSSQPDRSVNAVPFHRFPAFCASPAGNHPHQADQSDRTADRTSFTLAPWLSALVMPISPCSRPKRRCSVSTRCSARS